MQDQMCQVKVRGRAPHHASHLHPDQFACIVKHIIYGKALAAAEQKACSVEEMHLEMF